MSAKLGSNNRMLLCFPWAEFVNVVDSIHSQNLERASVR